MFLIGHHCNLVLSYQNPVFDENAVILPYCIRFLVAFLPAPHHSVTEWWGAGVVICLELGADLHMSQWMPLPLIVSCFSKIQIGFTFLVPAHPGSPGKRAVKRVPVCVWDVKP